MQSKNIAQKKTARMYVKAEAVFKLHKWKTNYERVRWQIKNTSKQKTAPQIRFELCKIVLGQA
jgi:hypothetical protein